ncbi:hypothetical protein L873DRAFT_580767 [Choiromyces venosus 120613-1]|uniref:Uncharacterized protein n=1 Tax=Choiromyces venosus 120613-1 TaxID=1336337 RepID=A0A3N4J018_9PEZI|nr:hypothetical protein L873DRAFT_580767 [Choiromyces venosus 120613-1]
MSRREGVYISWGLSSVARARQECSNKRKEKGESKRQTFHYDTAVTYDQFLENRFSDTVWKKNVRMFNLLPCFSVRPRGGEYYLVSEDD